MNGKFTLVCIGIMLLAPANNGAVLEKLEGPAEVSGALENPKEKLLIQPLDTNFHMVTFSGQIVNASTYDGSVRQDRITYRRASTMGDPICQLRIDFLDFQLAGPGPDGTCKSNDKLTISTSQSLQNFEICGKNQGQHLYLHYGDSDVITVNILMQKTQSRFSLNTTFFSCYDPTGPEYATKSGPEAAPYGCTQYYNDLTANVKSFNYLRYQPLPGPQTQINRQQYMICVKDYPTTTAILWQLCSKEDQFFISGCEPGVPRNGSESCPGDYVDIPGSEFGRYCGSTFYQANTIAKPFNLWVNFDDSEGNGLEPETNNGGFCLKYVIN